MRRDRFKEIGDLYKAIGQELAEIVGDPDGTFLYVEAGDGWIGPSIFKDEGAQVRYFRPSGKLDDLLFDVWKAEDPEKRWAAMEYIITGSKFSIEFVFSEDFGEELDISERRELVLRAR